jgi:para-nitrobenzyl esterase
LPLGPIVSTRQGKVRGHLTDGTAVFRGIPYAAAPVGANRLRAPQPAPPWDGVRDAIERGATAPAPPFVEALRRILPEVRVPGDDYLNLTVWTPDPGAARLPVLVWIHGGSFTNGSSAHPSYEAHAYARDGIVTVALNYRLGVEGFALLDGAPCNRGLLDQIAALRWVHENISAFGGDPDNVTIAGQSAGAMSVCTLIAMPAARGLFRRAIAQSGAASIAMQTDDARIVSRVLAQRLGCEPTAAGVAAMPIERVLEAQLQIANELRIRPRADIYGEGVAKNALGFCPIVDGESLPVRPIDAIRTGAGAELDLLIGTTAHEYRLYLVPSGIIDFVTEQHVEQYRSGFGLPADAPAVYAREDSLSTPGDVFCAMITDYAFRIPACRVMETRANGPGRTYAYRFDWRSSLLGGRLGAFHSLDVPFVFDTIATGARVVGDAQPQELAAVMRAAWSRFVASGDPGWPAWNPEKRPTMRFDLPRSEVCCDPGAVTRRLWDGLP